MSKDIIKNKKGFSLIETLIAVSILMIAIAGPLSLVQAGLFSSIHQRNQVTATYLAQEALEYVKNVRDTNSYSQYTASPVTWLTGLSACLGSSGCYVDPHGTLTGGNFYIKAADLVPMPLNQVLTGTVYSYSYAVGTPTTYTRVVKITPVPVGNPASDEITVSVTVGWNDNLLARSYTVSENIYNYEQ